MLLVDLAEAARRLALSPRHVRRLAADGRVAYARVGRALRFRPEDLAAFAASSVVTGRNPRVRAFRASTPGRTT